MDVTTIGSNALLFANLPPANRVSPGRVYRVSNVGPAPGIRLEADGTLWRPLGGSQVLARRFVSLTRQDLAVGIIETFGPFPGGLVRANMGLRVDALWGLSGIATGLRGGFFAIGNTPPTATTVNNALVSTNTAINSMTLGSRVISTLNAANDTNGPHPTGMPYISYLGVSNTMHSNYNITVDFSQPWYITAISQSAAETAVDLSGATWAGGVATFTATAHTLAVGDKTVVAGVTPAGWNGTFIVASVPDANTFTVAMAADPGTYTSGGTSSRISNVISRNVVIELLG